ncbi:hypothetical protein BVC93_30215 [Mycobacterium sp. MS1601]|uniref:hypothetical protein n=1 Tax=Mycobacterium sp. MS1601 TaxID=1936029 RepID=UPI00097970D0|nr:hypothetical protein [Mycobacterium sp. MS1601]AQA06865.1 hypothetical protein BVC93_30215 [Mycobacterium sp. MS1601]
MAVSACSSVIAGTATWPGATLEKVVLGPADFPDGVEYHRIDFEPGQPDGAGGPPAMLSKPPGCSDGLTNVIAASAQRGPGSAEQFSAGYDGARIVVTVLSWHLNLDELAQTAARCETFQTFFDPSSPGIPMVTTKLDEALPAADDALVYQQTMNLSGVESSVYMTFANIGPMAMIGLSLPVENPGISAKATLPQTFLDVMAKQSERIAAG